MAENREQERQSGSHPTLGEHPEQRRQEQTGREDASDPSEVGRPPAEESQPNRQRRTA